SSVGTYIRHFGTQMPFWGGATIPLTLLVEQRRDTTFLWFSLNSIDSGKHAGDRAKQAPFLTGKCLV
ncbi:hypothetical protein, partial [Aeromonas veronii]|uniref:hypothetical protein n=1 Tax=Aeromonas veronii TaxID=654 RepID=UPI001C62FF2C